MYYPILRGKQFELIALRELATKLPPKSVTPFIEPVRTNLKPLTATIECLFEQGIVPVIVVNPSLGDFSKSEINLTDSLNKAVKNKYIPCIKISTKRKISEEIQQSINNETAVFLEGSIDKTTIALINDAKFTFINTERVSTAAIPLLKNLIIYKDSFDKQSRNADYEESSFYSNTHVDYKKTANAIGFGDFTILSEDYSESGGPAYVVTIHLSYIDGEQFDSMYVRHFSSFNDDSPTNPGGKFSDALRKLTTYVDDNPQKFYKSTGLTGLLDLNAKPFPGLGVVKKMSLKHHIETIADYIGG